MRIIGKLTIFFFISLLSLVCPAADEGKGNFSIVGVWMLKSETAPDGKTTSSVYTHYTRCKIYDADSTYYTVQLHAVGDEMMILAHEMGRYRLNDSIYMERDRVMPLHIINDSTVVLEFEGYKETIVRTHTMTEERKEEIRNLVRQYPNDADAPVKHFVLSTTERELKAENRIFLYTIILMCLFTIAGVGYVMRLRRHKREMERKLAEIEEANQLRPEPVAKAMKEVESDFFQSDHYRVTRGRIDAGENFTPTDWKELERQLKIVYPNFASSLFNLYDLSPTEWQVCMLLKLRIKPADIASVLKKEKSSISNIRTRLYKKVFDKSGTGKDWDEFILSL
ncbi:MAG: hypothetical protein IJ013_04875 [Bacteroidaceae bacterium]|nr:hypothetical protein [Bacteroidaceae bacterium]